MKNIIEFVKSLCSLIYLWGWLKPTRVIKEPSAKIKAVEVAHAYMVVQYHGQRINMLKTDYVAWKAMSRKDKRAMAQRMAIAEKKGQIRFEEIDGHLICIRNKDYNPK